MSCNQTNSGTSCLKIVEGILTLVFHSTDGVRGASVDQSPAKWDYLSLLGIALVHVPHQVISHLYLGSTVQGMCLECLSYGLSIILHLSILHRPSSYC